MVILANINFCRFYILGYNEKRQDEPNYRERIFDLIDISFLAMELAKKKRMRKNESKKI